METKKYNSKYSRLSAEEKKIIEDAKRHLWYKNLSEERKQAIITYQVSINNTNRAKHCDICNKDFKSIYGHYKTKKHINNVKDNLFMYDITEESDYN